MAQMSPSPCAFLFILLAYPLILLESDQPPTAPIVQAQFDPPTSSIFEVPLNTAVTFTCTSTGGRPPASLRWTVTESGTPVSVNPTYTSSNNSQGVGDATSTFNFTITKYGVTYRVQCTASGPDPIQDRRTPVTSLTTEKVVTSSHTASNSPVVTSSHTPSNSPVTMEDSTVNLGLYIKTGGTTDNQITPPAEYDGRVELVDDVKLKLTGVTPEDERQYKCTVAASLHIKTSFINLHLLVPTNTTPNNPVPVGVRGDCFGSAAVAGAAVGCLTAGVLLGGAAVFMLLHFRKAHVHRKMNPTEGDMLDDGQYEDVRPGTGTGNEVTMATFHQPSQPPQPSAQYQELRPAVYQSLQRD
uniref:Ig-like domain-containing protein n=1 Tax=Branchiostoma floridae TaxID=7739 RepID=C3ZJL8_BRAFL|eukprot:XP_002591349.1 hypothetical protein BRAFLDRAFT_76819 [Branchiostoma floridae]